MTSYGNLWHDVTCGGGHSATIALEGAARLRQSAPASIGRFVGLECRSGLEGLLLTEKACPSCRKEAI